jgi:hypothetical protein
MAAAWRYRGCVAVCSVVQPLRLAVEAMEGGEYNIFQSTSNYLFYLLIHSTAATGAA